MKVTLSKRPESSGSPAKVTVKVKPEGHFQGQPEQQQFSNEMSFCDTLGVLGCLSFEEVEKLLTCQSLGPRGIFSRFSLWKMNGNKIR